MMQSANPGAAVYFTVDGTLPTTGSFLYSAPLMVTSNVTLTASAFASGFNNSFAATAQFAIQPLLFTGPGTVANDQFVLPLLGVSNTCYVFRLPIYLATGFQSAPMWLQPIRSLWPIPTPPVFRTDSTASYNSREPAPSLDHPPGFPPRCGGHWREFGPAVPPGRRVRLR